MVVVVLLVLAWIAEVSALMQLVRVIQAHAGTQWGGERRLRPIIIGLMVILIGSMLLFGFGLPGIALLIASLPVIAVVVMFGGVFVIYAFFGGRPN